jgi:hypothetical protein
MTQGRASPSIAEGVGCEKDYEDVDRAGKARWSIVSVTGVDSNCLVTSCGVLQLTPDILCASPPPAQPPPSPSPPSPTECLRTNSTHTRRVKPGYRPSVVMLPKYILPMPKQPWMLLQPTTILVSQADYYYYC